jgi:hypothetical protein
MKNQIETMKVDIGIDKGVFREELIRAFEIEHFNHFEEYLNVALKNSVASYIKKQGIELVAKLPLDGYFDFLEGIEKVGHLSLASLNYPLRARFSGVIKLKKNGQTIEVSRGKNTFYTKMSEGYYFDNPCPYFPSEPFIRDYSCSFYSGWHGKSLLEAVHPYHAIEYTNIEPFYVTLKELKTQWNLDFHIIIFDIQLNKFSDFLSVDLRQSIKDKMFPISYFKYEENRDNRQGVRIGFMQYSSLLTGKTYTCECCQPYLFDKLDEMSNMGLENSDSYTLVCQSLKSLRPRICHICTIEDAGLKEANTLYGEVNSSCFSDMSEHYLNNNIRVSWVYNNLEHAFKTTKWINEDKVFKISQQLLPLERIVREASPIWLYPQRIDVYFPDLKVAIEYQGKQHFEAIDFFGGELALEKNKERDLRKAQLCKDNDVHLIYVNYDENVTTGLMKRRLRSYL